MSGDVIRTGTFYIYGGGTWLYPPQPVQGWQCPVCEKVHAPWVASCDCHMNKLISNVAITRIPENAGDK